MKICVAQTKPTKGNIDGNVDRHKSLIGLAVSNGADMIVFPELSLTGYEPNLSRALATDKDDRRFDDFQRISDAEQITIGVGVPTANAAGVLISMIIFRPNERRQTYSKQFIHPDEEAFFVGAEKSPVLLGDDAHIALAICYELSVPAHAADAAKSGADIYIASVAKCEDGVQAAIERLSEIAKQYSMVVMMSNFVGESGGCECAGRTSVWNHEGSLVGQLDDSSEGILVFDTETHELVEMRM